MQSVQLVSLVETKGRSDLFLQKACGDLAIEQMAPENDSGLSTGVNVIGDHKDRWSLRILCSPLHCNLAYVLLLEVFPRTLSSHLRGHSGLDTQ